MVILDALKAWIQNVPENIRLYRDHRRSYQPGIYELYMCYFTCIITFFHVCGHAIRSATTSLASLVASSCIARLTEELDHRDDINYMTSINNWYLMVATVPLIHYEGGHMDYGGTCSEELEIIVRALKQMQLKWPQTTTILTTVERLRRSKGYGGSSAMSHVFVPAIHSGERDHLSMESLRELFPFPPSMCPRMGLFENVVTTQCNSPASQSADLGALDNFGWIFDEWFEMAHAS